MSVATLTEKFLNDELENPTLTLLEGYDTSSVDKSINSLSGITKMVAGIKNFSGLEKFSKNTTKVKKAVETSLEDIDNTAFKNGQKKPLPVSTNQPIRDEKTAQVKLRQFYNYMKDKVVGLKWNDVASSYTDGKAVVTNILVSLGILAAGAMVGGGIAAMSAGATVAGMTVGAAVGAVMVAILAFFIVVISVSNAVDKSQDFSKTGEPLINFKQAWRDTIKTFKQIFSGKERFKELGTLQKVAGIMVPLTMFMAFSFSTIWSHLFKGMGTMVGKAIYLTGDLSSAATVELASNERVGAMAKAATGIASRSKAISGSRIGPKIDKIVQFGRDVASGQATSNAGDIIEKSQGRMESLGKLLTYVVLPLICLAIVLFLISELVDAIQLRKLQKQQEEQIQQQQQSTGDIF